MCKNQLVTDRALPRSIYYFLSFSKYRDSYLRFCSRPFTLACGHESIHLCNNAIQARYTNAERSSKLPTDNMWDNKTFIQFLKEQGHGDKWHTLIYPTMKKCLISKLFIHNF